MYLEKVAIDYLKGVNIARIFKKYFISENTNKSINIKGSNNEFLEHREYYYSDELKNVNWKLYAKMGKLYTKVFSTDISNEVLILFDISKSMLAGKKILKLEYSKYLVSIVAYKLVTEGYKVVFSTFDSNIYETFVFSEKNFQKFDLLLREMRCGGITNFSEVLRKLPSYMGSNSNLLVISDFLFISAGEISVLRKLFPKRDIVLFQVLSAEEISFIDGDFVELVEPESNVRKLVQAKEAQKKYIQALSSFLEQIYISSFSSKIPMITFSTDIPYYVVLKKI
ncbi:MAG: DUF58 domain-containing protein [Brevinematia bacterium]